MLDLFGNDMQEPVKPAPRPSQLDLFETTIERIAFAAGRAPTQIRCELLAPGSTWSTPARLDTLAELWRTK
jgi:hypothetical protein